MSYWAFDWAMGVRLGGPAVKLVLVTLGWLADEHDEVLISPLALSGFVSLSVADLDDILNDLQATGRLTRLDRHVREGQWRIRLHVPETFTVAGRTV